MGRLPDVQQSKLALEIAVGRLVVSLPSEFNQGPHPVNNVASGASTGLALPLAPQEMTGYTLVLRPPTTDPLLGL